MNKFMRIVGISLALVLLVTSLSLVMAQDAGPGAGGPVIWGNQRGSANIDPLTPLRCSGVDCADINALLYPGLIGIDPQTQNYAIGVPNNMATGYTVSDDGLVYTFTLRDDLTWNDGTPITAYDIQFMWLAMQNMDPAEVSSSLAPTKQAIVNAEAPDAQTLILTYETADCTAINRAGVLAALPAHGYGWTPEMGANFDWTVPVGHAFDTNPSISHGPFKFSRTEAGTAIYLEADQNFTDPINGQYVVPQGMVYLDVPDYNVMAERFNSNQPGDVNYMNEPDSAVLPTLQSGPGQIFSAPGRLWHYVSLNLGDPDNPVNGQDENGNVLDQGHHPILGDVRVRQALQYAVDVDAILNGPINGNGTPMVAGTIPTAYTIDPNLTRRPFDLTEARRLLDEAGWVSTGNPLVEGGDGQRSCQGCMYAAEGTAFVLDMMNPGDVRNDVSVLLQAQFAQIGVNVIVRPLDFNTMYDDNLGTQIYDTAVAGWRGALPFNPDQRSFFGVENDIVSSESPGFNFGSYYNAEFEQLSYDIANNPGCIQEDIIAKAQRVQQIFYDEQPYLWLYAFN
ncbi:MAG: hypothetical protein K8I60_13210, partial [Anaerolineae bacterium]|nr:hypothetical protein [Anaerolineae bacterium]